MPLGLQGGPARTSYRGRFCGAASLPRTGQGCVIPVEALWAPPAEKTTLGLNRDMPVLAVLSGGKIDGKVIAQSVRLEVKGGR